MAVGRFTAHVSKQGKEYLRCEDCWTITKPDLRDSHQCPRDSAGTIWRRGARAGGTGGYESYFRCTGCEEEVPERDRYLIEGHTCPPGADALRGALADPVAEALETWALMRTAEVAERLSARMQQAARETIPDGLNEEAYLRGLVDVSIWLRADLAMLGLKVVDGKWAT